MLLVVSIPIIHTLLERSLLQGKQRELVNRAGHLRPLMREAASEGNKRLVELASLLSMEEEALRFVDASGEVVFDGIPELQQLEDRSFSSPTLLEGRQMQVLVLSLDLAGKKAVPGKNTASGNKEAPTDETESSVSLGDTGFGGTVFLFQKVPDVAVYFEGLVLRLFLLFVAFLVPLFLGAIFFTRRMIAAVYSLSSAIGRSLSSEHFRRPIRDELQEIGEWVNRKTRDLEEHIEEERKQRTEYEAAFETLTLPVFLFDANRRLLRTNNAGTKMIPVGAIDYEGKTLLELMRNTEMDDFFSEVIENREAVQGVIRWGEERSRYISVTGGCINPHKPQSERRFVLLLDDVTLQKHLEKVRKDFVANVSHELKTPITLIKGFVETLKEDSESYDEQTNSFFDIIKKHTDRLINIIDDLFKLSSLEEEGAAAEIDFEIHPLHEIVTTSIGTAVAAAEKANIKIEQHLDTSVMVYGNPRLLGQVIGNLVDNAVKYNRPGGKVDIELSEYENEAVIMITDTGIGIPEKFQNRIFERFYRVDKTRSVNVGGTGLGLAIVRHIVQLHGGSVEVESEPGRGSCFRVVFPRVQAP
ncbi:MAG: hypothetical protein K9L68_05665 [Spirochaetales bacterium]|nr:hypothetical protein [Spirochaetales bacterium]MCF7938067.1 hypothetical protein [Spirochaetales bacterium]